VVDAVWCLGDTVGYGPQPSECAARLRAADALWVAGNHERAATGAISVDEFNPQAARAALWTMARLDRGEKDFLDALPETLTEGAFTLVHGSLRYPIWEYIYDRDAALGHLALQSTPFSFVGHTHVPMAVTEVERSPEGCEFRRLRDGDRLHLNSGERLILNPGSVGQPRDGDPRASYGIYDAGAGEFTLHRASYDIGATQHLMEHADLPRWLIERLEVGR
jgi:diadenosine tetraphosphatase ApaH/serine/threonine PP2A family protein phosphatase